MWPVYSLFLHLQPPRCPLPPSVLLRLLRPPSTRRYLSPAPLTSRPSGREYFSGNFRARMDNAGDDTCRPNTYRRTFRLDKLLASLSPLLAPANEDFCRGCSFGRETASASAVHITVNHCLNYCTCSTEPGTIFLKPETLIDGCC